MVGLFYIIVLFVHYGWGRVGLGQREKLKLATQRPAGSYLQVLVAPAHRARHIIERHLVFPEALFLQAE